MSTIVQFADIGKTAKKLVGDDFITEKKVSVKSTTGEKATFQSTCKQALKPGSEVVGELSIKTTGGFLGSTSTIKVLTSGVINKETVFEKHEKIPKGLKATNVTNMAIKDGWIGDKTSSLKLEYVHEYFSTMLNVQGLFQKATAALAVGHKNVTLGGEVSVDDAFKSPALKNYDIKLAYDDQKESEVVLAALSQLQKIKLTYSHQISKETSVAAEVLYSRGDDSKVLTMAAKHSLDKDTTLKGKIDSTGGLALSYAQQIKSNVKLIMATTMNVKEMEKGGKLGISLAYE